MTIALTTRMDSSGLELAFDSLSKAVRGRIARDALRAGSVPVVAAIRAAAPQKTGLLASGFRASMPRQDRPERIAMLIRSVTTRARFASAHPRKTVAAGGASDRYRVYYGTFVEFGHKASGIAGEDVPAHPFVRPSVDSTSQEALDIIEDKIGEGIAQA